MWMDIEAGTLETSYNRDVSLTLNVTGIFNASAPGVSFSFYDFVSTPEFFGIDLEMNLYHPLDDPAFNCYDTMVIMYFEGSGIMNYDADLTYPQFTVDQVLLNADGYTRWFNPGNIARIAI